MAIDRSAFQAPVGLLSALDEVEVDMPMGDSSVIENDDGSVDIVIAEGEFDASTIPFGANLAEYLEESELQKIANDVLESVEADKQSRSEWETTLNEGLEVLGLKYEKRTIPWKDACGAYSAVLAEAAIRFQAEAMAETFPAQGPVKTKILGEETNEKREAAERVRADMNYELTEIMSEYRPEHERLLYSLGLSGSAFKKVYFDPNLGRQVALFIPAEDVIVPYGASNIESAERVTHVLRKTENEIFKLQASGFYRDIDLPEPTATAANKIEEQKAKDGGYTLNNDDRYRLYEVHVDLVIDGVNDGIKLSEGREIAVPYVVTIDEGSNKVLAIRRNWTQGDQLFTKRQYFVHYVYVPGFGFYGLGLLHIVGGYARAGTSLIRQLVDAGTLANLQGGFKTRGMRVKGDDTPIGPGEWKDVDLPSGTLKDNILPMPYKEPSVTLLQLLDRLTEEGRRLAAISDVNISDMSANAPVGTTLALLERTLKPMTAVQARVHYAMKQEFKLLHNIIAKYAPDEYGYTPDRAEARAKKSDYALVEVIPVSDPNSTTMAQRVVQYQAVHQLSQSAPQIYNLPQLHRQTIEVLGVKNADKLVPIEGDVKATDPVSENMNVLVGSPVKAFIYQDHDAHMAAHQAFLQDPMIMQTIGQNPMANQIVGAMQAHIAEHLAFSYRKQMEERLGAPLPAPNEEIPEAMEVELSRLLATAGQQLAQNHAAQAAQAQAQAQAQDPVLQLKREEVGVKKMEVMRKLLADLAKKDTEESRIAMEFINKELDRAQGGMQVNNQLKADVIMDILSKALEASTPPNTGAM